LALTNSGIFTSLLTHGFLGAIVVCLVLPRPAGRGASGGAPA
jgi:hypothetical protein